MKNFAKHLLRIDDALKLDPEVNFIYEKDFEIVRDYVLQIMCKQHKHFAQLYDGSMEFGSHPNDLRIRHADEFDVLIKFMFPFHGDIQEEEDYDRPGIVNLDFTDVCARMAFHHFDGTQHYCSFDEKLMDFINMRLTCNEFQNLERTALQGWLHLVFRLALLKYGNKVQGSVGDLYTLSYVWRGVPFTITAKTAKRTFTIDFVPAVVFNSASRGGGEWLAVPKTIAGPKETAQYSFILCNPDAEKRILDGVGNTKNVKVVLRLLQSLRNKKDLPDLKCYFLVTACMWELKTQSQQFWLQNSIDALLIHMLDVLAAYFGARFLPFYWDADSNLVKHFSASKCEQYAKTLTTAHKTLSNYMHQPQLSLSRTATHFDVKL